MKSGVKMGGIINKKQYPEILNLFLINGVKYNKRNWSWTVRIRIIQCSVFETHNAYGMFAISPDFKFLQILDYFARNT